MRLLRLKGVQRSECLCVPLPNTYVVVPVLGGGAFGRCLGHEGGDLRNGIRQTRKVTGGAKDSARSRPVGG